LSFFRNIAAFLIIAALCSVLLAYFGALFNYIKYGLEEKNVAQLVLGPLFVSPLYFLVIALAGIIIGIPVMQVIRNLGLSNSCLSLSWVGTCAGALTGLALFGWWIPMKMLVLFIFMSSLAGGLSGLLWYVFVERHCRQTNV
jgi:hypothetical protein